MKTHTYHQTGARHLQNSKPCQDRYLIDTIGSIQICAVADGHGHDTYSRAGLGARLACHAAYKILRHALEQGELLFTPDVGNKLSTDIQGLFRRYITKHLLLHPLTEYEKEKLPDDTPETYVYGTTLMCSVLTDDKCMILKLGDGETHAINANGEFLSLFPNYIHSTNGETQSMVQEDVRFEIRLLQEPIAVLIHFTDGYIYQGAYPYALMEVIEDNSLAIDTIAGHGSNGDDSTILLITNEALLTEHFFAGLQQSKNRHEQELMLSKYRIDLIREKQYLTLGLQKMKSLKSNPTDNKSKEIEELQKNLHIHFEKWQSLSNIVKGLETDEKCDDIAV